jgi:hypothetical protein
MFNRTSTGRQAGVSLIAITAVRFAARAIVSLRIGVAADVGFSAVVRLDIRPVASVYVRTVAPAVAA